MDRQTLNRNLRMLRTMRDEKRKTRRETALPSTGILRLPISTILNVMSLMQNIDEGIRDSYMDRAIQLLAIHKKTAKKDMADMRAKLLECERKIFEKTRSECKKMQHYHYIIPLMSMVDLMRVHINTLFA